MHTVVAINQDAANMLTNLDHQAFAQLDVGVPLLLHGRPLPMLIM